MSEGKTKEAQDQSQIDDYKERGPFTFGPWTSHIWRSNPRHMTFLMACYKFIAKMLQGRDAVPRYAHEGEARARFAVHDVCKGGVANSEFDAAHSLDVIEHVPANVEGLFMRNLTLSLKNQGVCLIGTPNITAEQYASPASKEGHINLKSAATLATLVGEHFHNVFNFSMNDEVVHTGFAPMGHYLFCLGDSVKC